MRSLELSRWDISLLAFFGALSLSSMTLYLREFPLKQYLFNIPEEGVRTQIGMVRSKQGLVTREILGESGFSQLQVQSPVYSQDTVVSGPDSALTVELDDGGTIELGPNTMIRLSFESEVSFDGISRAAKVKVITGDVTGKSQGRKIVVATKEQQIKLTRTTVQPVKVAAPKPVPLAILPPPAQKAAPAPVAVPVAEIKPLPSPTPLPSPSPLPPPPKVIGKPVAAPIATAPIFVKPGSKVAEVPVALQFKVDPPDAEVTAILRKLDPEPRVVFQQKVRARNSIVTVDWAVKSPGNYEYEIQDADGLTIPLPIKPKFKVKPDFEGLQSKEALVSGRKMTTNLLSGKRIENFEIALNWDAYPGATRYKLWIAKDPNARRPLLEKEVSGTSYVLNKGKIFSGKVYYRVTALLESGFRANSKTGVFEFDFLPPLLVKPMNQTAIRQRPGAGRALLFTWQKTNFTNAYELEIAKDSTFRQTLLKLKLPENFRVISLPTAGIYWWRVRAYAGEVASKPSAPWQFQVVK